MRIFIMNRTAGRLVLLLMLFLSISQHRLQAQPPSDSGPRFQETTADDLADAETQWMKKKLKLKKPELAKVKEINLHYAKERMSLQKNSRAAQPANADRLKALEQEKEQKLRGILSEKQFTNYLKKREEIRDQLQSGNNSGFPPPPPDRP